MDELKLSINLLPKGAWNNDLSKTLPKKEWDVLRNFCYKKANYKCEICGIETHDLDAHEVWDFDVSNETQTLKNIIAICTKCHGVIHFKNSVRLGYGQQAKEHFMKVNKCSEMEFVGHLYKSLLDYNQRNKIFRWKIIANLNKFGGKGIEIKLRKIKKIVNPYKNIDWDKLCYDDYKKLFKIDKGDSLIGPPKIISVDIDNYQGLINIKSLFTSKIEWFLDGIKIKTKYNIVGKFSTSYSIEGLKGNLLSFKLTNEYGYTLSKFFKLEDWE